MTTHAPDLSPVGDGPTQAYDVVVIGGGPAGVTAATLLQRHGHRCLVLEGAQFPRYHIGESLIPGTYDVLERLGLLPKMRASGYPVKHSVRFVGPTGREADPFYFSETIEGERARTWQVDRASFDQLGLDHARETGVEVRMATRVGQVLFDGDRAVGVRVTSARGDEQAIDSKIVIDASGRSTHIGTQLGLKEDVSGLNKSSAWSYYRGARRRKGIDAGETTVFMLPGRDWFWYIPLPDDIVSVGIVSDPQRLPHDGDGFEMAFGERVRQCPPLVEFLSGAERVDRVRGLRRLAYRNRQTVGDGWVMIGDAAAFLDPIYSSGLFLALTSAALAADNAHEALAQGDVRAERLGRFVEPLTAGVAVIRRLIDAFYSSEFSFGAFARRFPQHRKALIDCLIGDVVGRDMSDFLHALDQMVPVESAS